MLDEHGYLDIKTQIQQEDALYKYDKWRENSYIEDEDDYEDDEEFLCD